MAALGAALLGWARSLRQSITSSHSAHASIIALDRDRPTATEPSALVGVTAVAAIASVVPLTVCRSPSVDPNAARSYVHTLSHTRRCGSHRHCANESHCHQCSRDQHGLSLSFSCSVFSGVNTARSAVVPLGTFVPLNIRRSCMPPPRGGVQAGSVVCGDHPKNQIPREPSCALPGGRPKK